ncbi:MAG TPA: hypothetical protein VFT22_32360 [Kofleriaceae bacterium]|nr:hypothetical protein [Kofleriaceae bacterium]
MAQALAAHVDCVVGMTGAIDEEAARTFSIGFYGALGDQLSVAAAFAHGRAAVNLEGLADVDQSQLVVRDRFNAGQLILAAEERRCSWTSRAHTPGCGRSLLTMPS